MLLALIAATTVPFVDLPYDSGCDQEAFYAQGIMAARQSGMRPDDIKTAMRENFPDMEVTNVSNSVSKTLMEQASREPVRATPLEKSVAIEEFRQTVYRKCLARSRQ